MTYYIAQQKGMTRADDCIAIAPTFHQLKDKLESLHLQTHQGIEVLQERDCKVIARFDLV